MSKKGGFKGMDFKISSQYKPTGDQPQAIQKIAEGFQRGLQYYTLL